jgi:hypothetical protein
VFFSSNSNTDTLLLSPSYADYKRATTSVEDGGTMDPDAPIATALLGRGALIKVCLKCVPKWVYFSRRLHQPQRYKVKDVFSAFPIFLISCNVVVSCLSRLFFSGTFTRSHILTGSF